jgi:hypothetical protein
MSTEQRGLTPAQSEIHSLRMTQSHKTNSVGMTQSHKTNSVGMTQSHGGKKKINPPPYEVWCLHELLYEIYLANFFMSTKQKAKPAAKNVVLFFD